MKRFEYQWFQMSNIQDDIKQHEKLQQKATKMASQHGFFQSNIIPGLWLHNTHPIQFCKSSMIWVLNTLTKAMPSTYKQS